MDEVVKAEIERLHDEEKRQNHRLDKLEESIELIQNMALSIQKLSVNMENMYKELAKQGERLETLEKQPADAFNHIKSVILTAVITFGVTYVCTRLF